MSKTRAFVRAFVKKDRHGKYVVIDRSVYRPEFPPFLSQYSNGSRYNAGDKVIVEKNPGRLAYVGLEVWYNHGLLSSGYTSETCYRPSLRYWGPLYVIRSDDGFWWDNGEGSGWVKPRYDATTFGEAERYNYELPEGRNVRWELYKGDE